MKNSNLNRLLQLVDEVFDVKNDSDQLQVNESVIERLKRMHPYTVTELTNDDGPVAWAILILTTEDLMRKFLNNEISESQLFELSREKTNFESIYLCSAIVLPEFRRKGLIKMVLIDAISEIKKDYPISSLFVWAFTDEGNLTAQKIADLVKLPLYCRE